MLSISSGRGEEPSVMSVLVSMRPDVGGGVAARSRPGGTCVDGLGGISGRSSRASRVGAGSVTAGGWRRESSATSRATCSVFCSTTDRKESFRFPVVDDSTASDRTRL